MKRKVLSVMLATAMTATLFAGCGSDASNANSGDATASTTEAGDSKTDAAASGSGSVYYLNFKPEQDQQWQDLAAKYTAETGTEVTVITASTIYLFPLCEPIRAIPKKSITSGYTIAVLCR